MPSFIVNIDGVDYQVDGAADEAEAKSHAMTQHVDESKSDTWYGRAGQAVGDAGRVAEDMLTFGLQDNARAWLKDTNLEDERVATQMAKGRFGSALAPFQASTAIAAMPVEAVGAPILGNAAIGSAFSAADASGHGGSPEDIAKGAGWGALWGGLGGGLGRYAGRDVKVRSNEPPVPSPTANVISTVGGMPKWATLAADAGLGAIGLPPVVTKTSAIAEKIAPFAQRYLTKAPDGRLAVDPVMAQQARDALARLTLGSGRAGTQPEVK